MKPLSDVLQKGVFVIAEIGCNFENDIERAKQMIRKAAEAGAGAVKFQTFQAEKLTTRHAEKFWEIEGCPGETQYEEFKQMPHLTFDQYRHLYEEAQRAGVVFFSTPEDEDSADLLEAVGVPMYKISSMNVTNHPLLVHVARKMKPIILSTGASTIGEIEEAIRIVRDTGNRDMAILHCISNYPTKDEHVNLRMLCHLRDVFPGIPVGYSDHTLPDRHYGILAAAVALGAQVIEKHFTFDASRPGYDHAISADYEGLKVMIEQIRKVEKALGESCKRPIESEAKARVHARRSVVSTCFIRAGESITERNVAVKRPGTGIEPRFLRIVVGRKAVRDIPEDTVIQWDMI